MIWAGTSTSSGTTSFFGSTVYFFRFPPPPPPPPPPKQVQVCPYAVMGLPVHSSMQMVKQRFRQLAKVVHPDLGGDAGWMGVLNGAYEYLVALESRG